MIASLFASNASFFLLRFQQATTETNNHQHDSNTRVINSKRHKSINTDITVTSFSGGVPENQLGAEIGTNSILL
ncbi:hypothetical protein AUEXF2481DRAFT_408625 [Aureobasidium subglaciale EXF-2481]|uniref:Secreted protein n=1 Tax=Aureobasidium subglaciale (strain EXF-2481) TaxID=1043005 RepID=A0A074YN64_AURSE|nr:uncharacterized protein AUEXF2481DRAFT_408625 [Aureobasidium subglaciale EXF-2481]KEQ99238.1 hypothetical protein AUEXF2481DRAFT_408625 [Aureobasidium subglaciale EXF-2481]